MPAELIDGKGIAERIRADVAEQVRQLRLSGRIPGLAVVLVGDDSASAVYVKAKGKACEAAGMHSVTLRLPADTPQEQLLRQIDALNADRAIDGILVQMPLPPQIEADEVIRRIDPSKDVDGFHPVNVGKLLVGHRDGFIPCTPAGIQRLIAETGIDTRGRECVVVGRSNIVGKPVAALMAQDTDGANCTVTVCNRYTHDLAAQTRRAEILIVAAGKPGLVTGDMIRPGAVVIDVGMNRVGDASSPAGSRLVGDVEFASASRVAGYITPVPGGVGPMTIAMLLSNTLKAAREGRAT